jgi:hypothetical protein
MPRIARFVAKGEPAVYHVISRMYKQFKGYFASKHKKKPKAVQGLEGVFSLKRLSENI